MNCSPRLSAGEWKIRAPLASVEKIGHDVRIPNDKLLDI
jgi:hypothetical protein